MAAEDSSWGKGYSLRALTIALAALLLVLSLGLSFYLGSERFSQYLARQLQVQTQDAATALGLTLSSTNAEREAAASIIDAMYDSGAYQAIELKGLDGEVRYRRGSGEGAADVPGWFAAWADLPQPTGRAEVMAGWERRGTVLVRGDPEAALTELWQGLRIELAWIGVIAAMALWLLWRGTRVVFRPLVAMQAHAQALEQGDFSSQLPEPASRELGSVTRALNRMTETLGQTFDRQLRLINRLQEQLRRDTVTGLDSRSAFLQRLESELHARDEPQEGVLVIFRLYDFLRFNEREGRERGNELLAACAGILETFEARHESVMLGRGQGAEFLVFLPRAAEADAEQWVSQLVGGMSRRYAAFAQREPAWVHAGLVATTTDLSVTDLLARADTALQQAAAFQASHWVWSRGHSVEPVSTGEWQQAIITALENDRLKLAFQPVLDHTGQLCHQQVMARMQLGGEWVSAGRFVPLLERYERLAMLDRAMVDRTLAVMADYPEQQFVVPLGLASLGERDFMGWLEKRLLADSDSAQRLWLAFSERVVRIEPDCVEALVKLRAATGAALMVDQFGAGGVSFDYLGRWALDGLRVDRSFVRGLASRPDARFFIESITAVARERSIRVWVSGVETADEWEALRALGVDGALGFHLCRPQNEPSRPPGAE